ncbi:MAG: hypothetical protein JXR51_09520 [Bacteroidales bacterium]|nr:hypothetical protein [Bacteroidales bacterium]MBN2757403.1 hypothetical protein [Bacteroidales bacterium]
MRIEKDFIGEKKIPKHALYGIHSVRAFENFPFESSFFIEWYKAVGITKLAVYQTYKKFKKAIEQKYKNQKLPLNFIADEIIDALIESSKEIAKGQYFDNFIIPAIQGGAGTSINLAVNEIITNVSLLKIGRQIGDYKIIDPIEHANIFQSTNDVIPTSLRVAILLLLNDLEENINKLRFQIEIVEKQSSNSLRIAYTQMQEAVPSSYGKLFSAYNDALSRDWWRVSKCFERIKVVNLGGSAVGTSITVPRFFLMTVVQELQEITNLPVTRGENLSDTTANLDSFVEIHAILKAHAVNLEKMVSDLRLLSSDFVKTKEIEIPKKQVGSSIMPSKVNPVIPEFVISAAHKIYSNDVLITSLSAQSCLDLNAYIPTIGNAIIESLKLLISANKTLLNNLFKDIIINSNVSISRLYSSPVIATALLPYIGYNKSAELSKEMINSGIDVFNANQKLKFIDKNKLSQILSADNLLKSGYSIEDII